MTKEQILKQKWEETFTTPYEESLLKDYEDVVVPAMDESNREAAIGFGEWARTRYFTGQDGTWHGVIDETIDECYTTDQLYTLYLKYIEQETKP